MSDPFTLRNDPPRQPPAADDPTRQRVLFSGLDCLPGQQDLFETDTFPVSSPNPGASHDRETH